MIYFFGCWGAPGHYIFKPRGGSAYGLLPRYIERRLDQGFCPGLPDRSGLVPEVQQTEGAALLHHVDGLTVLAFWDRTGDRRHGSNSAFVATGEHSFDAMLALAREQFPSIMDRLAASNVEIRLAPIVERVAC